MKSPLFFCKILFLFAAWNIQAVCLPLHGNLEYLYYYASNSPISVPLITANANPLAFGIIGEPGTRIVFGAGSEQDRFNFGGLQGARLSLAACLNESAGVEASVFALAKSSREFRASSVDGLIPSINLPFFSTQDASEDVLVNRLPNTATAQDSLRPWGFELHGSLQHEQMPIIGHLGLSALFVEEHFSLQDAIYNNPSTPNRILNVVDNFTTKNHFFGLELAAKTFHKLYQARLELTASLSLGQTHQQLKISGQTNLDNQEILQAIGLFAEPSNSGTFKQHPFALLSAIQASISYPWNQRIRSFLSYNGLYLNRCIRAANQIDRNINLSQNPLIGGTGILSGPAAPLASFKNTPFWLQGISLGLVIAWDPS